MQENYDAFAHQAKLMTSIHAPIPPNLKDAVTEAKLRGEEGGTTLEQKEGDPIIKRPRKQARTHTAAMKKTARNTGAFERPLQSSHPSQSSSNPFVQTTPPVSDEAMSDSDHDDPASASKENNPTLSPSPVYFPPPSPRKTALGKRPLSVLSIAYPDDSDADMMLIDSDNDNDTPAMTSNERNITANARSRTSSPLRKTPKLSLLCGGVNASGRLRDEMPIFEDLPQLPMQDPLRRLSGDGKENRGSATARGLKEKREYHPMKTLNGSAPPSPAHAQLPTPSLSSSSISGSSTAGISKKKATNGLHKRLAVRAKPRIGIRRL
jgi:ubiquitin-conjugating enzyme E2 S